VAVYRGPVCRLCRREGIKLFLKGDRCYSAKCAIDKRATPPGQHGQMRRRKASEFSVQLRAKQRAKRIFGMLETQFALYYRSAARMPGMTGQNLLTMLETRLDNVVYRMGFASSRPEARQLVSHGHVQVNGRGVTIASFRVRPGDTVSLHPKAQAFDRVRLAQETARNRTEASWLSVDQEKFKGEIKALPTREEMDNTIDEQLIVEHYSR
jgi:small subunit ribosomal protein S4